MVAVQLMLRATSRTRQGIARVRRIAGTLGIQTTTSGSASVSGEMTEADFESLFGRRPDAIGPRDPGPADFGSPGGHRSDGLPVPKALATLVESITVAPPFTRL